MIKDIVVVSPIKNNNEYLVEFVEHYLNLGFDKIYLYDNNDDDSIQPAILLKKFILKNKVIIIDYRNTMFNDLIPRRHFFYYGEFEWVLYVDDDEFLVLQDVNSIKDFINLFDNDVHKIAINHMHYGDNDYCYAIEGRVQDRFKNPLPMDACNGKINSSIKSLIKRTDPSQAQYLNPHSLLDSSNYYDTNGKIIKLEKAWQINISDINYEVAYIKHYITKSLEEYIRNKIKRLSNSPDHFKKRYDLDSYYFHFNKRTKEKEELAKFFIDKYL